MISFRTFTLSVLLALLLSGSALTQTEDVRAATGLPIPIGAAVIYGQVSARGISKDERRPIILVTLLMNGVQVDRVQTNDRGFYYFLRSPQEGAVLVFEVDNAEIGRDVLTPGIGRSVRRDVEFDWKNFSSSKKQSSEVVSVRDAYPGRSPESATAMDKARTAAKSGKSDEALELLRYVVEKDSKDFPAWTELGTVYFSSGKLVEAETAYKRALELKPDFILAIMNLGKLQMSQKQYENAVVTLTRGIQSDPNSADAFHYLGESYLQIKQGTRAVIALNEAIRLAPIEKADLHLRLATLYNAAGAKPQAVNEYKLFLQKNPNHKEKEKIEKYIKENSGS
jgi:Flp pilus assembly protein TadD